MKSIIMFILLCFANVAFAGSSNYTPSEKSGIIEPSVATGAVHIQSLDYTYDNTGNILISGKSNCRLFSHACYKNEWVRIQESIPVGKQYVGFRMGVAGAGYSYLEIYWK